MATPNLTAERIHQVRLQNDDLFWRQPNVHAVGEGYLKDATGGWRSLIGIIVYVRARVDQSTLPEADRIPELLDGVPTEIRQETLTTINLMGTPNDEHRPLTSGITIQSVQPMGDTLEAMRAGTLTGVAWRNGEKVLVTAAHVMAACDELNPTLTVDMYQELVAESELEKLCDENAILYTPTESKKIGDILAWTARYSAESSTDIHEGDFAICDIDINVTTDFLLHEHPHGSKVVIPGVVDPTIYPQDPGNPMILTMVGARSGMHTLTVRAINEQRIIGGVRCKNLTVFEPTDNTGIKKGDSGAACLYKVGENRYKMSCILTASSGDERRGFGFPASTAERLLGIKFGNVAPVVPPTPTPTTPPTVTPVNHAPVAVATAPATVHFGEVVTLNGSGSSDPDTGDTITYQWEQIPHLLHTIQLSSATAASPTFTAPTVPATLGFRLTVTDNHQLSSAPVTVSVNVESRPPVVSAGSDETVASEASVTLQGSASDPDGDTLTYSWRVVGISVGTLTGATTLSPTFTAPEGPTGVILELTATDNHNVSASDQVTITVLAPGDPPPPPPNNPPVANAGLDQTVATHVVVTLDGSRSRDPDTGDTLTYAWKQVQQGSEPWITTLLNTTSAVTTFISPTGPASLTLRLTVTDNHGATGTDTVSITVFAPPTHWTDTGNIRGSGADREKEQTRTGPLGQTETQWVSDPEPVIWSRWSRTGSTRGCGPTNAYEESRTSNYGDTNTRWISDPEAETWGNWTNTGRFMGSCDSREAQQTRTSNCNNTQTQWVVDPEPIIWGPWTRTGLTRGRCSNREAQESSVSNCAGTQTRWFSDPEPETWGPWTDTGRTQIIDAYTWFKEQSRTSDCDNTETRWVAG